MSKPRITLFLINSLLYNNNKDVISMQEKTETKSALVVHVPFIDKALVTSVSDAIAANESQRVDNIIEASLEQKEYYDLIVDSHQAKDMVRKTWADQLFYILPKTIKTKLKKNNLYLLTNSSLNRMYILTETQFNIMQRIRAL